MILQTSQQVAALVNFGKEMCYNMVHKICFQVGQELLNQQHGHSLWIRQQRCVIHSVRAAWRQWNHLDSENLLNCQLAQPVMYRSWWRNRPSHCTQWGESLLGPCIGAKMLWLFPIVSNGLSAPHEPFHPPKEWAAGDKSGEHALLHVSGGCYNVCFQPLQFTLHSVHYFRRRKKCWKVFKIEERLPLKCGEVIKQGVKHIGRHCQGCLWFGLGAEPEASEMATTLFSPCFLFPLQWKNSCFSPAQSFTSGWWQADKSTTEYFLCLAEESPLCLCGKESHSMQGSRLQSSCQKFPSPSLQFSSSCSFTCFFHLCSYCKKNQNKWGWLVFPRLKGD